MTRTRILCLGLLLVLAMVPMACLTTTYSTGGPQSLQTPQNQSTPQASAAQSAAGTCVAVPTAAVQSATANEVTCKMLLLGDLAEDATYAKWIVDTIPTMIQPGTWDQKKGTAENRSLSYFAPGKVLVVYHTAAVQAKVDEFLKGLKHASAQVTKPAPSTPTVQQAQFVPTGSPAPGYPVAAPVQQPKHLFHFIIRYEGEGLLDSNVVNFVKAMQAAGNGDLGLFKVSQNVSGAVADVGGVPPTNYLQQPPSYNNGPPASSQSTPQTNPPTPANPTQKTPPVGTEPVPTQPSIPSGASQSPPPAGPPPPTGPSPKMPPVNPEPETPPVR